MKKIIFVLLTFVFVLNSCSVDDNEPNIHYVVLPVSSYSAPDSFAFGETYPIDLYYKRPTTCHFYEGIYFERVDATRIIGIQCGVRELSGCETLDPETTDSIKVSMDFIVIYHEPYTFKFYKGTNEQGEDIFEEKIIPVVN